jgi:hypothetical protein
LLWRLRGLIKYLRGRKEWGVMSRKGFADPDAVEPETAGVGIAGETAVASVGKHN